MLIAKRAEWRSLDRCQTLWKESKQLALHPKAYYLEELGLQGGEKGKGHWLQSVVSKDGKSLILHEEQLNSTRVLSCFIYK